MSNPQFRPMQPAGRRQDQPQTTDLYFIYVVQIGALALGVGTQAQSVLQIQADSDFEWIKAAAYAFPTGATENSFNDNIIPEATVSLQDTGSGRFYMNNPVPISSIFGTGRLPYILPFPQRFIANATINFTVANLSAAQAYTNVTLSLIGKKLYRETPR